MEHKFAHQQQNIKKPLLLVILDGFGLRNQSHGNAIKLAKTPTFDNLYANYPWTKLNAAGNAVGLPVGQMGNSEVGHLNIGAGQIVFTGLSLIDNAIKNHSFFKNAAFLKSISHVKQFHSTLHLIGLLSPGGVHSLQAHLFLLLDLAHQQKVQHVTVHIFTDGRDVAPESVKPWLKTLLEKLNHYKFKLGSISGRLYAMDRDQKFDKTVQTFEALQGRATHHFTNALEYIDLQYAKKHRDEFIEPAINDDVAVNFLKDNDSVIFFNFRPDRARQLSHLIVGSNLYTYKPDHLLKNVQLTTMMKYEGITKADIAFDAMDVENPLGKVLAQNNLTQLRIAETQKYAHVTFFFDGGHDIVYPLSKRILIDSPKIDNFALQPAMSAEKITTSLIQQLTKFDVLIVNYANADMVGHTGNLKATIKAIEVLDHQMARLLKAIESINGVMFITADHGNAEIMLDENDQVATKHTSSDVPLICSDKHVIFTAGGKLANVSPTILDYLNIKKPSSMTEKSLIFKNKSKF